LSPHHQGRGERGPPREKEREKEKLSLLFGKLWSDDPESEPINNGPELLKYSLGMQELSSFYFTFDWCFGWFLYYFFLLYISLPRS
jgi:hypothetical protein